jgi:dinuclear metal center YbgI/SA1388 family protein
MKVKDILTIINKVAPFFLQEEYDNSGIQFADLNEDIHKILLCLDVTQDTIEEAIKQNCNTILSHHPLFFKPLKRITKQDNPIAFQLIYHQLNLIAAHTNYDLAENGLNDYVGKLLNLEKIESLENSSEKTFKLAVYVPDKYHEKLLNALFKAGAGNIGNYSETSFTSSGKGSFKPSDRANPFIGKKGEREIVNEVKIETVFLERNLNKIIKAIYKKHPYEEPAYDIYQLKTNSKTGIGLIANLSSEQNLENFCKKIKSILNIPYLRIVRANKENIRTIALCTGSGGSLIKQCINKNVDLFITGDIDHHEALEAKEMGLNIIDIEHFYTEKYFVPAIREQLIKAQVPEDILFASERMDSPFQLL